PGVPVDQPERLRDIAGQPLRELQRGGREPAVVLGRSARLTRGLGYAVVPQAGRRGARPGHGDRSRCPSQVRGQPQPRDHRGPGLGVHGPRRPRHVPRSAGRQPGPTTHPHIPPQDRRTRRLADRDHHPHRWPARPGTGARHGHRTQRGHQLRRRYLLPRPARPGVHTMIEVKDVTKRYGGNTVVDDVSLSIPSGGITSVIGSNGAGKSTLLSMISRLIEPDEGSISVDGLDVSTTPTEELARRLAVLRQDNHTAVRLTVRELVSFGRFPHSRGRLTTADHEIIDDAIDYFELSGFADRPLDTLSGGQRQRAHVAMVLCQSTDYVLLDEPLNNLDMRHSVQIMRRLRSMADDYGKT